MDFTLNIRGQLLSLSQPVVMGILNATPDSFYADSRQQTEADIVCRAHHIVAEGGTIIDIGACSTRPGGAHPSQEEEMSRMKTALTIVRRELPEAIISVDTFRVDIAKMAVEEYGADIINDVSEGRDSQMLRMVARLRVPYILMAAQPDLRSTLMLFAEKVQQLRDYGQKDIILDPGFGFGKTVEENFLLLGELEKLSVMQLPVLVGISRKSMIYKTLNCTPAEALNGTTALHALALAKGASILRVHDVKEAVDCCRLVALATKH